MHRTTKKYCEDCGVTHQPIMCLMKPRRPIKKISDVRLHKKQAFDRFWYENNPPGPKGTWNCYLDISPQCQKKVTRSTINLEHAYSKTRHPEYVYCLWNVFASCRPCNKQKGSLDITDLVDDFPHLKPLVDELKLFISS